MLDSYQHTNALALVVLSALLAHYEPRPADAVAPAGAAPKPSGARIPELPPMDALDPEVAALVEELNGFGEDTEPQLIASMYRHLAYWPAYLALVRTMLVPLQREGRLNALTLSTRALGHAHGAVLASQLKPAAPPETLQSRARLVPPVRRTSDRAHDRALRADPARHDGVSAAYQFEHFSSVLSHNALIVVKGTLSLSRELA